MKDAVAKQHRIKAVEGVRDSEFPAGDLPPPPTPASWNLPATLSIQQSGTVGLRQYVTNDPASEWTISVSNLPAGVTYNAGLERLEGAATGTSSGTATFTLSRVGGSDVVDTATVSLTDPSLIVPALTVEYVDTNGVRQTTPVVDGVTTITGTAPFLVHFDATGTRAPAAFAADNTGNFDPLAAGNADPDGLDAYTVEEAYAYSEVGFRLNYGEGVGGVWDYPEGAGLSRDEDTGPPIFGRVYESPGNYTARLKVRDVLGNESTISLSVVVQSPASTVHIPVSQGSWPQWVSGTRYTIDRGGNYSGFGALRFTGANNVSLEAVGVGSRPVVGAVEFDGRYWIDSPVTDRASAIRLVGVEVGSFTHRPVGYDFCGFIDCYLGPINDIVYFEYDSPDANTSQRRANLRYPRGLFFWRSTLTTNGSGHGYVLFGLHMSCLHIVGSFVNHDINNGNSVGAIRIYPHRYSIRHSLIDMTAPPGDGMNVAFSLLIADGDNYRQWSSDDLVGAPDGSGQYAYPSGKAAFASNQIYSASRGGLYKGVAATGSAGGRPFLVAVEDIAWHPSGAISTLIPTFSCDGGKYFIFRNTRRSLGVGEVVTATLKSGPVGGAEVPAGWYGPYIYSPASNSRPTPSTFAD